MAETTSYPVTLEIDYPDRDLDRLSSFFRCITAIPPMVILGLLQAAHTGSLVFLPTVLMILFRRKYPRWWFDWNVALTRFSARVGAYVVLLTDEYPSTEREQSVHIGIPFPDVARDLMPGMPLIKWFLAIPHYVVLGFLGIGAGFAVIIAWFAILFTGRYPRGLFDYVVGTGRWGLRVCAYSGLLVTDIYPPFSLK
jgi:hypothetical protein